MKAGTGLPLPEPFHASDSSADLYGISLLANVAYTQLMAIITQGTLASCEKKCSITCRICHPLF